MRKLKYLLLIFSLVVITSCGNNNDDICKHFKSDWIIDVEATCTSEGSKHIECTKCKESIKTETIDKTNHDLVHHEALDPTCTTPGYEAYEACKNCSYTTYKEIKALGHNYVNDECTRCHDKEEQSNLIYELNNSKTGYWVTGVKEETTKITVPATYNNKTVVGIEKDAFRDCYIVEEIEISDNVIYILDDFSSCNKLKKLLLPANASLNINNNELKEIIFTSAIGLEKIKIINNFRISINAEKLEKLILLEDLLLYPCTIIDISSNAYNKYDNCNYLGTITNPYYELVSVIDTSISSININLNTKVICHDALNNCGYLESIEIPNSVTTIKEYAFSGCSSLTSIVIPESVTSIGYGAFENCTSLTSIEIPTSVTSIGERAFFGCNSLENVYYDGTIEDWCNITFSDSDSNPMYYATHFYIKNSNGEYEEVTEIEIEIPDTITKIGNYQFYEFNNVTKITIPTSVISIGNYAFRDVTNIKNLIIPESVTSIGNCAFDNCKFENVYMSNNIKTIGRDIFIEGHVDNLYYDGIIEDLVQISFESNTFNHVKNLYVKDNNNEYKKISFESIKDLIISNEGKR